MLNDELNASTMLAMTNGKNVAEEYKFVFDELKEGATKHLCKKDIVLPEAACGSIHWQITYSGNGCFKTNNPQYYAGYLNIITYLRDLGYCVFVKDYTLQRSVQNMYTLRDMSLLVYWGNENICVDAQITDMEKFITQKLKDTWGDRFIDPNTQKLY